jgi:hypothetical protein
MIVARILERAGGAVAEGPEPTHDVPTGMLGREAAGEAVTGERHLPAVTRANRIFVPSGDQTASFPPVTTTGDSAGPRTAQMAGVSL